ncbi:MULTISPECIES: TetR/AcrR family transcriptional regulator [unclassified Streptomyces]|uniref:TetR/AcrR family transcriptional regulator n=1 Tax=unclassified Streptomyces TaxID=2593676 RepID=UPI00278C3548|nr:MULTISPECIES: TetR/AcrR family transcriptional regulator [unclassified Streptomyces]
MPASRSEIGKTHGPRYREEARQRLLSAARVVFQEVGPEAPLDLVVQRAGVGIATLYRRFPSREDLIREVCLDVMREVTDTVEAALREEPDAYTALVRVLHHCVDTHSAGLLPVAAGRFRATDEVHATRDAYLAALTRLLERARAEGALQADVNHVDVLLLLTLISRPLPGLAAPLAGQLTQRFTSLLGPALAQPGGRLAGPLPTQETLDELWNTPVSPADNA